MRCWSGLTAMAMAMVMVIVSSATAAAEPTFTRDPLAGALVLCVDASFEGRPPEERRPEPNRFGPVGPIAVVRPIPTDRFSSNEIHSVIFASKAAIRGCYQKQLDRNKDLSGKIVVTFEITANGTVASATIKSTTMKSPPVEACVLGEIRKLVFPAKGPTSVTYPFIFSRG